MTGLSRDTRGVTTAYSFILLFGILTLSVSVVYMTGTDTINTREEYTEAMTVTTSMETIQNDLQRITHRGTTRTQTNLPDVQSKSTMYFTNTTTTNTTITVGTRSGGSFDSNAVTVTTPMLTYKTNTERRITLDTGMVFESVPESMSTGDTRTVLAAHDQPHQAFITLTKDASIVSPVTFKRTVKKPGDGMRFTATEAQPSTSLSDRTITTTPSNPVVIEITSRNHEGWVEVLRANDLTPTVNADTNTVRAELDTTEGTPTEVMVTPTPVNATLVT